MPEGKVTTPEIVHAVLFLIIGIGLPWLAFHLWKAERDFVASLTEEEAGNYPGPM